MLLSLSDAALSGDVVRCVALPVQRLVCSGATSCFSGLRELKSVETVFRR